jgi:hypothetical protein
MKAVSDVRILEAQPLVYEGTWGIKEVGEHASTLQLWQVGENTYQIEWDIPTLEEYEKIGIFCEAGTKKVVEWDGLMGYPPKEAYDLLHEYGFDTTQIDPDNDDIEA